MQDKVYVESAKCTYRLGMPARGNFRPVIAVLTALAVAGCSSNLSKDNVVLAPLTRPSNFELRPTSEGNVYDSKPESFDSCVRWSGKDVFAGCSRRVAKVSLVAEQVAPTALFYSVADLKVNLLNTSTMNDTFIREKLSPQLSTSPTEDRRKEERLNIAVDCELVAVKKESDQDYHVIIGDAGCASDACFLNAEISGLPLAGNRDLQALTDVRAVFETFLGPVSGGYSFWQKPIAIRISGSLFFDVDHKAGEVGPTGSRPDTSWEIHPVRSIQLRKQEP